MPKRSPGISSTTEPPIEPGNQAELDDIAGKVAAELQPDPAAPDAKAAATDELVDVATEKLDELAQHPEDVQRTLQLLTEEELATVIELGFGLVADSRGKHWEITERRSLRIAKWLKLSLEKHAEVLKWLAAFLPELVTALLLSYEVWTRIKLDGELKVQKAKEVQREEPAAS
jgi:hypothetical protein